MSLILFISLFIIISFGQSIPSKSLVLNPFKASPFIHSPTSPLYQMPKRQSRIPTKSNLDNQFHTFIRNREHKYHQSQERFFHYMRKLSDSESSGQLFFDAFKERDDQVLSFIFDNPILQSNIMNSLKNQDRRKLNGALVDAITSKYLNVLQFLLSSGKFNRDHIMTALISAVPPTNLAFMMNRSIKEDTLSSMIVSSISPETIATILNNGRVQQVLDAEDFLDFFIQLVKQSLLTRIKFNEAAQRKIMRALSEKDGVFVDHLLHRDGGSLFPFAIDVIMRTGMITRESIMNELTESSQITLKSFTPTMNLLHNIHVQSLLTDADFGTVFFKAIYNREWGLFHFFRNSQMVKPRILQGIRLQSFRNVNYAKAVFSTAIKVRMIDAISLFGDSEIISRKDLLQYLMSHFTFGPFASRNDYMVQKTILSNEGFLSVLTDTDLELILHEAIQRKYFRFILELDSIFFDRISTKVLQDLRLKIQYMTIDWWDSVFEKSSDTEINRHLVGTALDKILNKRV